MSESETGILALKPIALKRKAVAQNERVRYRVYVTPDEFVAVIAENALMAMKLSGITAPLRIMRDLPLTQSSIESERLTPHHMQSTVFLRPEAEQRPPNQFEAIHIETDNESRPFEPLPLSGLHKRSGIYASTIDVSVLLNALPGEDIPVEPPVFQRDKPLPVETQAAEPPAVAEPAAEAPPIPGDDGGLSPEEVERLLNEPRA